MIQPLRSPGSGPCVSDDEVLALFDVVAHEDRHDLIGDRRLFDRDLQQERLATSIVVSRNSSQSISPRPFNRWKSLV